jgi:hypothetical protein
MDDTSRLVERVDKLEAQVGDLFNKVGSAWAGYICYAGDWAEDRKDICVVRDKAVAEDLKTNGLIDYFMEVAVYDGLPATVTILYRFAAWRDTDPHMKADGYPNGAWMIQEAQTKVALKDLLTDDDRFLMADGIHHVRVQGIDHQRVNRSFQEIMRAKKEKGEAVCDEEEMEAEGGGSG